MEKVRKREKASASSKGESKEKQPLTEIKEKESTSAVKENEKRPGAPGPEEKLVSTQKRFSRTVLILGVLFIVWWTNKAKNEQILVKSEEVTQGKYFSTNCGEIFAGVKNIEQRCGRVVSDALVTQEEIYALRDLVFKRLKFEKLFDLRKSPKNSKFIPSDKMVFMSVKSRILRLISEQYKVNYFDIYLANPLFLLKEYEKSPKYLLEKNSHMFTSVVDLAQASKEYKGGRLIFLDNDGVNRTVESRPGRLVVFTQSTESKSLFEPVNEGERVSLIIGFTLDKKSSIEDPEFSSL